MVFNTPFMFNNKIAVITGAATGLGEGIAVK
jgi:NAD(P)-dependent dehydrogenase (short-subunit alcohol dehydrogenase family)